MAARVRVRQGAKLRVAAILALQRREGRVT